MAKRQRSVSLSFVLLRFAIFTLASMLACALLWWFGMMQVINRGFVFSADAASGQVAALLAGDAKAFTTPGENFLAEYALFDEDGTLLESNVEGKKLEYLTGLHATGAYSLYDAQQTYADGSTAIFHWRYRVEYADPALRATLPPFEYLWLAIFGVALVLCLLFNTLWLRRRLAAKLKLFSEVSEKVGAQELDFTVPHAGIREYDQALDAMEHMRVALYNSLSSQWAAQQKREAEIAALAHDLKTPLTLVGGNAELLLDEELPEGSRKMVETIAASNNRAKQYVASLLETSAGAADEAFESTCLPTMFDELCRSTAAIAQAKGVCLQAQNGLEGTADIQKDHLIRAFGNVVQNAIEHTPLGGNVYLEGGMESGGWQIVVRDEGPGFSKAALHHATEHLWRGDAARESNGHNGLGLWFAAEVVKSHGGQLILQNDERGGVVTMLFATAAEHA